MSQMNNNKLQTIYRVEGLLANLGDECVDSDDVYFFYDQQDAKTSIALSWHKITPVEFEPSATRNGLKAIGTLNGQRRLLGRIIPVGIGAVILNAPTHL